MIMASSEPQISNRNSAEEHCWQSDLCNSSDRLSAMYNLSQMTDLTISFPDYEGSLQVHRLVLAMSSPVFEAMLLGAMAAGTELSLPDDSPEAFMWLMGYIYCNNTSLPDVATAVQVYHLANKYQIKHLSYLCSQFLQRQLNADNLPLMYDTALLLEDSILQHKCREIVSSSTNDVLCSANIGQLSSQSLRNLLQNEFEVRSELVVFRGLLNWGTCHSGKTSTETADQTLREEIEEFLSHVRFLTMTLDDFVEHVVPSNILSSNEIVAIIMKIKGVGSTLLPPVCCQIQEGRTFFEKDKLKTITIFQGKEMMNDPSLNFSRRKITKLQNSSFTREPNAILQNMKVSKNIHLSCIKFGRMPNNICRGPKFEIKCSSKSLIYNVPIVELRSDEWDRAFTHKVEFKEPLALSSNMVYSMAIHDSSVNNLHFYISSATSEDLCVKGNLAQNMELELQYWRIG